MALIDPRAASSAGLIRINLTVKADKHAAEILATIQAMLQEAMDQYEAILITGLVVEFNDGADLYGNLTVIFRR